MVSCNASPFETKVGTLCYCSRSSIPNPCAQCQGSIGCAGYLELSVLEGYLLLDEGFVSCNLYNEIL